jgi:exosortase
VVLAVLILCVLVWSYGSAIWGLMNRWWNEPDYLYGFLVPVFSGYLLWRRRDMLAAIKFRGNWLGLPLLVIAGSMRWASAYYFFALLDPLSLLPCLLGVALLVGGWPALRWSWPAILFLGFMIPLPGFVAGTLSHPLQRIGSICGTFVIQTLGIPSVARGNVIVLPEAELGVAEACNGLPMMMLFFAVCFGATLLSNRTWYEKLIILACAAPIAVAANILRISLTAILYRFGGVELANKVFHDLAGWLMMPLAVVLLWIVLWFLDHALVAPPKKQPLYVE